jgi:hypothetical protein
MIKKETRYNKGLVNSQLKAFFTYNTMNEVYNDQAKVYIAWSALHEDPEMRPRLFNVRKALKLKYDFYVIVSGHPSASHKGQGYEILQIRDIVPIYIGLPISKLAVQLSGGMYFLGRLVALGGVTKLIQHIESLITNVDSYEHKGILQDNVELLNEISKGLIPEGMLL